ncbi:MAG: LSU ribosomal protein L30p (L7e), partial [uncultured Propionibacteriaceae bacterium]
GTAQGHPDPVGDRHQAQPAPDAALAGPEADPRRGRPGGPSRDPRDGRDGAPPGHRRRDQL